MGSPGWIVVCASKVNRFRQTLSPEEAERFNECLIRLCRNPHVDKVHKFSLPAHTPIASLLYRDDDFVLVYYPTQVTQPFAARKIEVLKATRVRDFDEGNTVPGR